MKLSILLSVCIFKVGQDYERSFQRKQPSCIVSEGSRNSLGGTDVGSGRNHLLKLAPGQEVVGEWDRPQGTQRHKTYTRRNPPLQLLPRVTKGLTGTIPGWSVLFYQVIFQKDLIHLIYTIKSNLDLSSRNSRLSSRCWTGTLNLTRLRRQHLIPLPNLLPPPPLGSPHL